MKQNNYFSIKRFSHLLRNDLLINQGAYFFMLIEISIAIYLFTYYFMVTTHHFSDNNYIFLFILYMWLVGVIVGSAFPSLTDPIKKTNYILSPGSIFEKFMVQFMIRLVIFIPIALVLFWIATRLAKASLFPDPRIVFNPATDIQDFHFRNLFYNHITNFKIIIIILGGFSIASILFAGSTYFNRFALIKTLIALGIIVGAVFLSMVFLSHIFYPLEAHGYSINLRNYKISDNLLNVQLAAYLLAGLSWLFFLPLAYFNLKEKEV